MKFRDIVVVSVAVAVIFICIVVIVLAVIFSKSKYKIKYFLWTVFIEIYYKVSDDIPFIFFKSGRKTRTPAITDTKEMDPLITGIDDNSKGISR